MDTVRVDSIVEVFLNSSFIGSTAGANIDDANGEMKVIAETRPRRTHFLAWGKLSGFLASSCDSHPTIPLSRSDNGSFSRSSRPLLLLVVRRDTTFESLLFVLDLEVVRFRES